MLRTILSYMPFRATPNAFQYIAFVAATIEILSNVQHLNIIKYAGGC